MRTNVSTHEGSAGAGVTGVVQRWNAFWFGAVSPAGLHWVRFLAGLLFLAWLLPLTGERAALFGPAGWFDLQAYREASRPNVSPAPIGWSIFFLAGSSDAVFEVLWWGALTVLALFTLGVATRVTAVLTWAIVVSMTANPALVADVDFLLVVLAFYLMIGYLLLGQWDGNLTLTERLLGPRGTSVFSLLGQHDGEQPPSRAANFALRLFQVHFVIAVATGALAKLQTADWWAGMAYWYPLHPAFEMDAPKLQRARAGASATLIFLSLIQYAALAWQLTFPLFAFRRGWRWLLLAGAACAWLGAAFILRLPIWGPLYVVACLSYLSAPEWQRVSQLLARLRPAPALAKTEPAHPIASTAVRPVKTRS